jgi:tetratricopeptide (TPR) repeat protein
MKFILRTLILLILLLTLNFKAFSADNTLSIKDKTINQVTLLLQQDAEKLNYNEVIKLSNEIILNREQYPKVTIAKTYLLLANVASNEGDLESAYQFTQDGLASSKDSKMKLILQIKLVSVLLDTKNYKQLLIESKQAVHLSQQTKDIKCLLLALSYRSTSFSLSNQYDKALVDLSKVEYIFKRNPSLSKNITLLTTLANANFHLENYPKALSIYLNILKLRFSLNKLENIEQTYYHLGNTYYRLKQFSDAYNAYWEAEKYAKKKPANAYSAYASQGLGLTLLQQKHYVKSESKILTAKALFYQYNLTKPYLETITSLVIINNLTGQKQTTNDLLFEAEQMLINIEPTNNFNVLYSLLADFYYDKKDMETAYFWQKKYNNALKHQITRANTQPSNKKVINNSSELENDSANKKIQQKAEELSDENELAPPSLFKYIQQHILIFALSSIILLLLCLVIYLWLKHSLIKRLKDDDTVEKSNETITTPRHTKYIYQKSFNMARKYSYPLTLGYISINNWQELTRQFNKKIVTEVNQEIASVITKHINEFENAGLIHEGEYLLIFPHQNKDEVMVVMDTIVSALKLRFFANLGDFSVTITYSYNSPNFQDIDPYVFLSQLSDPIKML